MISENSRGFDGVLAAASFFIKVNLKNGIECGYNYFRIIVNFITGGILYARSGRYIPVNV